MKFTKLFLLILVSMPLILAADCGFGWHEQNGVCLEDYLINYSTIVIFITFTLIAIIYALGKVIENTKLIHWSETEAYELLGTALILSIYLSGSSVLDNVIGPAFYTTSLVYPGESSGRTGGTWSSVEAHVTDYLQKEWNYLKDNVVKNILMVASISGVLSTASLMVATGPTMMSVPVAPAFGGVQQFLAVAVGAVAASAIQLQMQISIVGLWKGMFNVLLPFGIALRAFPFTRTAGGAAIAIAVGFTIILPISYLIVEDVASHYWSKNCGGDLNILGDAFGTVVSGIGGTGTAESAVKDYMLSSKMSCTMFKVGIEAAVLPFFAYAMMLNITRRLAEAMGAQIDFSTLVRLI